MASINLKVLNTKKSMLPFKFSVTPLQIQAPLVQVCPFISFLYNY